MAPDDTEALPPIVDDRLMLCGIAGTPSHLTAAAALTDALVEAGWTRRLDHQLARGLLAMHGKWGRDAGIVHHDSIDIPGGVTSEIGGDA